MSNDKTERLAEWCDHAATTQDMGRDPDPNALYRQAAAELRRLDAVSRELLEALTELLTDMKIAQSNMRSAARRDSSWEGCAEAIQPRVDAAIAAIAKATDV